MPRRPPPLIEMYDELLAAFGPQHWWPGETPLEVVVGAVLVQNTSWKNVERAIANLKQNDLLDAHRLHAVSTSRLEKLLHTVGYYRVKARRLKNVIAFLVCEHGGSLDRLFQLPHHEAREQLLSINGVGPETADSILLYAGEVPRFVVDAYTRRLLVRHGWLAPPAKYEQMQAFFERRLEPDAQVFNEYHALVVRLGVEHCKPKPQCDTCPLQHRLPRGGPCEL